MALLRFESLSSGLDSINTAGIFCNSYLGTFMIFRKKIEFEAESYMAIFALQNLYRKYIYFIHFKIWFLKENKFLYIYNLQVLNRSTSVINSCIW